MNLVLGNVSQSQMRAGDEHEHNDSLAGEISVTELLYDRHQHKDL